MDYNPHSLESTMKSSDIDPSKSGSQYNGIQFKGVICSLGACEVEGIVVAWDGSKFTKVVFAERCSQVLVDAFQDLTDCHSLGGQCYGPPSFEPER